MHDVSDIVLYHESFKMFEVFKSWSWMVDIHNVSDFDGSMKVDSGFILGIWVMDQEWACSVGSPNWWCLALI